MSPLSLRRSSGNRRRGRRATHKLALVSFETLEPRTLLSNVTWTGVGDGTSWSVAGNWSDDAVPTASDDVTINLTGNHTIRIDASTQATVNSLLSSDALAISAGSLQINASSSLTGGLAISSGGSLTAIGSGVSVTVSGAEMLSAASLYAENGATLDLSALGSFSNPLASVFPTFEAIGAGSVLDLPALSTVGLLANELQIDASAGGQILLPSLPSLRTTTQSVTVTADGAGTEIDLSGMTSFSSPGGYLQATNRATILDGMLTKLSGINVTLDGTQTMATSQWTSLTAGSLSITGGVYDWSDLSDFGSSSVNVELGARVTLPAVKTYLNPSTTTTLSTTFQASGVGSVLSLPALASLTQLPNELSVAAASGAQVLLPLVASINTSQTNEPVWVTADGVGTSIDLSAVTTYDCAASELQVTDGATVLAPKLTSLNNVTVILDGSATIAYSQWASLTNGVLTIEGGSYSFTGLKDIDSSNLTAQNGGSLTLPAVTSFDNSHDQSLNGNEFVSTGTGSVLDLPALATVAPQEEYLEIDASAGGETLIPMLTSITNTLPGLSDFEINADAAGSTIDVSSLATINLNPGSLSVTNGGTVLDGKLTSVKGLKVSLDGTGTVATAQISSFSGGSLTVTRAGPERSWLDRLHVIHDQRQWRYPHAARRDRLREWYGESEWRQPQPAGAGQRPRREFHPHDRDDAHSVFSDRLCRVGSERDTHAARDAHDRDERFHVADFGYWRHDRCPDTG